MVGIQRRGRWVKGVCIHDRDTVHKDMREEASGGWVGEPRQRLWKDLYEKGGLSLSGVALDDSLAGVSRQSCHWTREGTRLALRSGALVRGWQLR